MSTLNQNTEVMLPPVVVAEVKTTQDPETLQIRLSQKFDTEVSNANGLLGLTMQGHSSFSAGKSRTMYQNFSKKKAQELGLTVVGAQLPANLKAKLVVHEFCEGDIIPEEAKAVSLNYTGKNTYVPRTWIDKASGQPVRETPKLAGKEGEVLTRDGKAIYRNTFLTIAGMNQEDLLIQHNNAIVGSTRAAAPATNASTIGEPDFKG